MRVSHYLCVLALLCGGGGLWLEDWVADDEQRVRSRQQVADELAVQQADYSRLSDTLNTLLVMTDLIFGSRETYLIDGALQQLEHLERLLGETETELTDANDLVPLTTQFRHQVVQLRDLLGTYADLEEAPSADQEAQFLRRSDQLTLQLFSTTDQLTESIRREQQRAQVAADAAALRTRTFGWIGIGIYCGFVLAALVWIARAVANPLRRLQVAAMAATRRGESFDPPRSGPLEVQQLTAHIDELVDSLQNELARSDAIMRSMPDTVMLIHAERGAELIKPSAELLEAFPNVDLDGWQLYKLLGDRDARALRKALVLCFKSNSPSQLTVRLGADGVSRHFEVRIAKSDASHAVLLLRDLTEKLRSENRIKRLAYYDSLTGLLNRSSMSQRLNEQIHIRDEAFAPFALAYFDIDRFKYYNDSFGHDVGDEILKHVATQVASSIRFSTDSGLGDERDPDFAARIGGDEFLVAFQGLEDAAGVESVIERLRQAIARPIRIKGSEHEVSVSIGVARFPHDAETQRDLILKADVAMYEAKRAGGGRMRLFDSELGARSRRRLSIENRLRSAIEHGDLYLEYQPQFDLRSGRIIGSEALVRWRDGDRVIPPGEFIPVAEERGLSTPLGELVLAKAIDQLADWQEREVDPGALHINVAADQFADGNFLSLLKATLRARSVPPRRFGIEITESLVIQDFDSTKRVLEELRLEGVGIAMDDFGTGYSSLTYLKHLPLDMLKIDRSFLEHVAESERERTLLQLIVHLGHEFDMLVLAEGVENEAQLEVLRRVGCDLAQGFLLGKPMSAAELEKQALGPLANRISVLDLELASVV
ncbi:MAG: bifunctional diguanylate cyclase/phosphodiesterase [Pseudomonadota bacterium]